MPGDGAVSTSQTGQPVQNAQSNDFVQQNHSTKIIKNMGRKETQVAGLWDFYQKNSVACSEVDVNTRCHMN